MLSFIIKVIHEINIDAVGLLQNVSQDKEANITSILTRRICIPFATPHYQMHKTIAIESSIT
ncbi:hypothetical protein TWF281_010835 [Arthrobotrys megalospora]